jgi:hypothetical protein
MYSCCIEALSEHPGYRYCPHCGSEIAYGIYASAVGVYRQLSDPTPVEPAPTEPTEDKTE